MWPALTAGKDVTCTHINACHFLATKLLNDFIFVYIKSYTPKSCRNKERNKSLNASPYFPVSSIFFANMHKSAFASVANKTILFYYYLISCRATADELLHSFARPSKMWTWSFSDYIFDLSIRILIEVWRLSSTPMSLQFEIDDMFEWFKWISFRNATNMVLWIRSENNSCLLLASATWWLRFNCTDTHHFCVPVGIDHRRWCDRLRILINSFRGARA